MGVQSHSAYVAGVQRSSLTIIARVCRGEPGDEVYTNSAKLIIGLPN